MKVNVSAPTINQIRISSAHPLMFRLLCLKDKFHMLNLVLFFDRNNLWVDVPRYRDKPWHTTRIRRTLHSWVRPTSSCTAWKERVASKTSFPSARRSKSNQSTTWSSPSGSKPSQRKKRSKARVPCKCLCLQLQMFSPWLKWITMTFGEVWGSSVWTFARMIPRWWQRSPTRQMSWKYGICSLASWSTWWSCLRLWSTSSGSPWVEPKSWSCTRVSMPGWWTSRVRRWALSSMPRLPLSSGILAIPK